MRTAIIGGRLIDGTGGEVLEDSLVLVEDSKIIEVGPRRKIEGDDIQILDVSGKTVMPGLIDCELHFAAWNHFVIAFQQHSREYLACKSVYAMRRCLEAGTTACRDLGGLEIGFCQAQANGLILGPRTQTSLVIMGPTNGLVDNMGGVSFAVSPQGLYAQIPGIPLPWCDGEDQCRAKVREVLRYGAHFIKIANTPWVGYPYLRHDRPLYTPRELEAIVDEAHRAGVQVACHTTGLQATLESVRAGVDIIGHGFPLDKECVREMAQRGTWYVPTFSIWRYHSTERNPDPVARELAKKNVEIHRQAFQLAMEAGVPIAMGSDLATEIPTSAIELTWMVKMGMSPADTIVAATKYAAQCMRMEDKIGTLEVGKEADLLVVDGNPLDNISILENQDKLLMVMQAGRPVSGPLLRKLPYQQSSRVDEKDWFRS